MAYTNDQIRGYADSMLSSGKSWQDVWNTAQTRGVGLEQLAGAYGMDTAGARAFAQQQGVSLTPQWMQEFNKMNAGGSGYDARQYIDPTSNRAYHGYFTGGVGGTEANDGSQGTLSGYVGAENTPWYQGQRGQVYDLEGNVINDFEIEDPNKTDWGEMIAKAFIAATTGGAAYSALAGAGAGYGAGAAVEPVSSLFPSATPGLETLAPVSQISLPSTGAGSLQTISTAGLPSAASTLKTAGAVSSIAKALGVGGDVAGKLLDNVGLKDIVNLLGGGLDTRNQNRYADKMLNYLSGQQSKIDQYYNPDSPEYKQLWQEMSRKDAAAGRNSQYGVRTTDFMGKVAKDRSDAQIRFMNAGGKLMETALGQKASAPTGLMSALDKITRSSGYSLKDVVRYLSDNGVQLTSVDTDYMNGNLTDDQYRAAASAAQLDTDPEANGAITDILGEDFDLNELWEY